ncbi:HAMP domain-containing protein [Hippea alviniae]|uniref:PDC sensor domain-containing protein n=1 Tax=Hippea alviniae TaxID=1279027 RepID=UPI0003B3D3A4|nr:HAMP domain-containing protein [Hippea alviniae]
MIKKLSTRIVVYTTLLVLMTVVVFSMSAMFTIMALKKYSVHKVETVFKENADENLEKEVVSYAQILKGDMDAKEGVSYMFGEVLEKKLRQGKLDIEQLESVYREMSNVLDIKAIAVFDHKANLIIKYPSFERFDFLRKAVKKLSVETMHKKIVYYDFHINGDGSVSFSFVYLGRDSKKQPVYIAFDYNPYAFYSLVKTAQLYPYSQKYLWVINKKGILIYDPPTKEHPLITLIDHVDLTDPANGKALAKIVKQDILKGKTGVARYVFRGVDKFVGYTYVEKYGWGLGLTLPTVIFYKPIKDLSNDITEKTIYTLALFGLFSSFIVLASIVITLTVSRRIIVPINRTVEAVEAILKGDYSKRLPKVGIVELDELADVVNKLVEYFDKTVKKMKEGENE